MRRTITKSEQDALGGYTADADDPSLQYLAEHDDEPITVYEDGPDGSAFVAIGYAVACAIIIQKNGLDQTF